MIVDTHCHLIYYGDDEIEALLARCCQAGVMCLQNVSTDLETFDKVASFSYKNSNIFCSLGVHPCSVSAAPVAMSDLERFFAKHSSVVNSVGETGLDYGSEGLYALKEWQKESFLVHAVFAARHNLPLIIHLRGDGAEADMLLLIEKLKADGVPCKGVLHCFTGSLGFMRKMISMGFMVSFSGIVTFKNALSVRDLVQYVPKDMILVETDSPYLSPHPFRGHRNEPSRVPAVLECVAGQMGVVLKDAEDVIWGNYCRLFGVPVNLSPTFSC